jgi:diaminopimelate epimerase
LEINFYKYQAGGNDFVIINKNQSFPEESQHIKKICDRRYGVGADGLIIVFLHKNEIIEFTYYNQDGTPEMCGNGSICTAHFVKNLNLISKEQILLRSLGHEYQATVTDDKVSLKMQNVQEIKEIGKGFFINTGAPHYIEFNDEAKLDNNHTQFINHARSIRNSQFIKSQIGHCNINYVSVINPTEIYIKTYEKGVEDYTPSCGTGAVAAALVSARIYEMDTPIKVTSQGGPLEISFNKNGDNIFTDIYLSGKANFVYKGAINIATKN